MDPQQSLDFSRTFFFDDILQCEKGIPQSTRNELKAIGHNVELADLPHGGGQVIQFNEKFFLKGELQSYPLTGSEDKFTPRGKVRFWPGCSIICKISLNSKLHQAITN